MSKACSDPQRLKINILADADAHYREAARLIYANDEFRIDDNSNSSKGEGGAFVAAWVWVSDSDIDTVLQCGTLTLTTRFGRSGVEKFYRLPNGRLLRQPMKWTSDGDDETVEACVEGSGADSELYLSGDEWRELEDSERVNAVLLNSLSENPQE